MKRFSSKENRWLFVLAKGFMENVWTESRMNSILFKELGPVMWKFDLLALISFYLKPDHKFCFIRVKSWDYSEMRIHGIGGNRILLGPILIPK